MTCGDEAYRCFGVGIGCAEAGESHGVVRVRGGVTPFGKAERKGGFRDIFGMLRKSLRCRKRECCGVGMMSERRGNEGGKRQNPVRLVAETGDDGKSTGSLRAG